MAYSFCLIRILPNAEKEWSCLATKKNHDSLFVPDKIVLELTKWSSCHVAILSSAAKEVLTNYGKNTTFKIARCVYRREVKKEKNCYNKLQKACLGKHKQS